MLARVFNRILLCSHQQWGHLLGMLVGFVIAIYSLPYLSTPSLPWIGSLQAIPLLLIKVITVPFISGMFANIFSNLGSAIDIVTNDKTLLHYWAKPKSSQF